MRDGFVVLPPPDGGFQFDTGVCGVALSEGYELLHDSRYHDAAKRAADWAMTQNLVRNWNYNAFSVWLLARTFSVTGERKYLAGALQKAQLGVLPGQMTAEQGQGHWPGRWIDQHNAKRTYHWVICLRSTLSSKCCRRARASTNSSDSGYFWPPTAGRTIRCTTALSPAKAPLLRVAELLKQFGPRDKWERAMNAEIHAFLQTKKNDLYAFGVYLRDARQKQ